MTLGTIIILSVYAAAFVYAAYHWRLIFESLQDETSDFGPGSWFVTILLAPVLLGLVAFLLAVPIAFTQGWISDSRPDGCYRQTTEYNVATKTNQTHYESVPCPEQRRVP